MLAAEAHVAALIGRFGAPPFTVPGLGCTVHSLAADGDTVVAAVEATPGRTISWRINNPEVLVVDPDGPIERVIYTLDENDVAVPTTVRLREDALAVAASELASFLRAVR